MIEHIMEICVTIPTFTVTIERGVLPIKSPEIIGVKKLTKIFSLRTQFGGSIV